MGRTVALKKAQKKLSDSKRDYLNEYKLAAGCKDCGYSLYACVLQFDHVIGEKTFALGGSVCTQGWEAIHEEIEKCDVVCANCHTIRTARRGGYLI